MSKPASVVVSTPSGPIVVSAPRFGEGVPSGPPWRTRLLLAASIPNRVDTAVPWNEFVYAAAEMSAVGVSTVSVPRTFPLSGLTRRFSSASETTRIASGTGLKSTPEGARGIGSIPGSGSPAWR